MTYKIIRDTREKEGNGWKWNKSRNCSGTSTAALKTGDYTLDGCEDFFTIERKGSVSEVAQNIIQKRFENELIRLNQMKYPFIIFEFSVNDVLIYPIGSHIPKRKWKYLKIRGNFIMKRITHFMVKYNNIKFIFAGSKGKDIAKTIFREVANTDEYKQTYSQE
jgi:hypothetical protein